MTTGKAPRGTGLGLDDLAEPHVKKAIDRLSQLIDQDDPRIALEASQLIIRLARPDEPGITGNIPAGGIGPGPGFGRWGGPWGNPWTNPWTNPWDLSGGNRAG